MFWPAGGHEPPIRPEDLLSWAQGRLLHFCRDWHIQSNLGALKLELLLLLYCSGLPWENQRSFCRSATVMRAFGLASNNLDSKPVHRKQRIKRHFSTNGRHQQCCFEIGLLRNDLDAQSNVIPSMFRHGTCKTCQFHTVLQNNISHFL